MREIKFRAWDVEDKTMFIPSCINQTASGISYTRQMPCGIEIKSFSQGESPNKVFLMQYTGLKDSSDKEIYEGDILQDFNGVRSKVAWSYTFPSFVIVEDGFEMGIDKGTAKGMAVIGNMYENPELLESK